MRPCRRRRLAGVLRDLVNGRLDEGRRVFAIVPEGGEAPQRFTDRAFDRQDGRSFDARTVLTWTEPAGSPRWGGRREQAGPPLRWTLVEIVPRVAGAAATTTTTTAPSTRP